MTELHTADYHLLSSDFSAGENKGLVLEVRSARSGDGRFRVAPNSAGYATSNALTLSKYGIRILRATQSGDPPMDISHAAPVEYTMGGVPRAEQFIGEGTRQNQLVIKSQPRGPRNTVGMPLTEVKVACRGFDPAATPLFWRLRSRHVFGRFRNAGGYRYDTELYELGAQWQGSSRAAEFKLFDTTDSNVSYDFGAADSAAIGGHAILSVAARIPNSREYMLDFVHLRIRGERPDRSAVLAYVDESIPHRELNLAIKAIYEHENGFKQFEDRVQRGTTMRFTNARGMHGRSPPANQQDCAVNMNWPDDPPGFPSITYDWGIGIAQLTSPGDARPHAIWDWQANVRAGAELLCEKLRSRGVFEHNTTWSSWMASGLQLYNGVGGQADRYRQSLTRSAYFSQIPDTPRPANARQSLPRFTWQEPRVDPPAWPPP